LLSQTKEKSVPKRVNKSKGILKETNERRFFPKKKMKRDPERGR